MFEFHIIFKLYIFESNNYLGLKIIIVWEDIILKFYDFQKILNLFYSFVIVIGTGKENPGRMLFKRQIFVE